MSRTPTQRAWKVVLREQGHRLTPQRELVLDAVDHLGHGTPEEIYAEVTRRSAAVNISTIYRNLALLEELGVVRVVHLGDRIPTYHSVTLPAHVHLNCTRVRSSQRRRPRRVPRLGRVPRPPARLRHRSGPACPQRSLLHLPRGPRMRVSCCGGVG